jgi:hypothetical protein
MEDQMTKMLFIIAKNVENYNYSVNKKITYYEKNKEKILDKYYSNKEERLKYQIEYNLEHKDELKERNKEYYLKHRQKMIDKANRYKENNKDKLCEKLTCKCGGKFLFVGKSKHLLTQKHINFMKKNGLDEYDLLEPVRNN